MVSRSPRLPEFSFIQEGLIGSHIHEAPGPFNDLSSTSSFPTDTHRKPLPIEPIESPTAAPTKSKSKHGKKLNPLIDLVETEEIYVTMLSATIRKVAAAWSRTNLPPRELDVMFRGIEAIFKANRRLLSQLKEIDQNPNNPNSAKALGDLLMNWIVDLEKPYTKFATSYAIGFDPDLWEPITSNTILPSVLRALDVECPPDSFSPVSISSWSLDSLFALPRSRLKYYRKLYTRLLKSTEEGRSDYTLLVDAIGKLDALLNVLLERANVTVQDSKMPNEVNTSSPDRTQSINNMVMRNELTQNHEGSVPSLLPDKPGLGTPPSRSPVTSIKSISTVSELDQKLNTDKVLDLFTLNPRPIQIQLDSPSLPFTRTIRCAEDVEIHFTPKGMPENAQFHPQGCLFLLTDLLLLCERVSSGVNDIVLLYPPLAGKHLRISETPDDDTILQVIVLKKETVNLRLKNKADREHLSRHFKRCIEAAASLTARRSQSPPPPVPPLKLVPSGSSDKTSSLENSVQELRLSTSQAVNEIAIEELRISHPADHSELNVQGADNKRFHDAQTLTINPKRISSSQPLSQPPQLSTFHPGNGLFQSPTPLTPYQPPPRGTSNAFYSSSNMQLTSPSHPYTHTLPGHLQADVTPHQRSLTPSPLPSQNQHLGVGYPSYDNPMLRRSVSATSLNEPYQPARTSSLHNQDQFPGRSSSANRPDMPFMHQRQSGGSSPVHPLQSRTNSVTTDSWRSPQDIDPDSPAGSPVEDSHRFSGPTVSTITAQFKCKIFLKLQHGQWKSLGSARLKLYLQQPTNVKQLVVESESKDKPVLISTIVLTDGVERVGKTGVAIELSDKGSRTGIIYLIQLRNDVSANGLFDSLLAGSDRAASRRIS